ncbi:hypothetical protein [Pedobacter heparinus]|uniref:Uncharacterized protein n=1 Tax=Pedobacter heparinus (strain ATCC 13125 / DSM 2366 / CIP 104194 / JCM 7457 / NBRC 12017 / NCIMB 9290 / NRRL B-14731 / HIM 762-3) TaxID=485917 RepID=C6XVA8_PEDHD|nr:hypothetical protein [Pedobacter heparinus]ACU03974.1 hypothetical protein Phep_1765 [Pedobacter heparinus DSM 2366]
MKRNAYLIILLVAATFTSCKKDKIEYANEFEKSYKVWTNFKAASGNSYAYTVSTSTWIGNIKFNFILGVEQFYNTCLILT